MHRSFEDVIDARHRQLDGWARRLAAVAAVTAAAGVAALVRSRRRWPD